MKALSIALVDDHRLLRRGLVEVIQKCPHYKVVLEADHGRDFIDKLPHLSHVPDLVLLDVSMPIMNGYETAQWLSKHHPEIKVMALSMHHEEAPIIRMIKNGARGFILKDAEEEELYEAIERVATVGFYYSHLVVGALSNSIHTTSGTLQHTIHLIKGREMEFLKLVCTELTYKEIADEMCLSPRTIDGYRESLFEKLGVKSRVGLVLFAMRNGLLES